MIVDAMDEVLSDLPKKIRDRIRNCPGAGQGVHQWLFSTALSLTNYFEDEQIIEILNAYVSCPGREQEIEKAVSSARRIAKGEGVSESRVLWPAIDYRMAHDIVVNSRVRLENLRSASPVKEPKSEEIIDSLFPGNPLLCLARKKELFWTKPRESWRGRESGMQFIVPNAMTSPQGKTKEGKTL
jgi:hypothetical protein